MLRSLKQTQSQLHHIGSALGLDKRPENKIIAHSMAERMLAQLESGKSKDEIQKDMKKSKEALALAQKAFFEKDPAVLQYL